MCWRMQVQSEDFFHNLWPFSLSPEQQCMDLEEIYYSYSSLDCPTQAESSLNNYRGLKDLDSRHIQVDKRRSFLQINWLCCDFHRCLLTFISQYFFMQSNILFQNKFYTIHIRKCNMKTTSAIITTSLPSIYRECKWSWFW